MLFKHLYTWIKYKTLPPSFLFKNRFFVERDSKRLRIMNNVGLVFRNERWTNWDSLHFDWKWIDLFILMSRYVGSFLLALFIWNFWGNFLVELPVFNKVALRCWLVYDFFDYYSLYFVWILLLMRSFIWDTFIVVLFSGSAKQYHPLARREEAARREANQMRRVVHEIHVDLPDIYKNPKFFIWTLLSTPHSSPLTARIFRNLSDKNCENLTSLARAIFRINYLIHAISAPNLNLDAHQQLPLPQTSSIAVYFNPSNNLKVRKNASLSTYSTLDIFSDNTNLFLNVSTDFRTSQEWEIRPLFKQTLSNFAMNATQLAKQRRFYTFAALNTPTTYAIETRVSYLKSFLWRTGAWFTPINRNIWAKSLVPSSVYNASLPILPFEVTPPPIFTLSERLNHSPLPHNLVFDLESSFSWLLQRSTKEKFWAVDFSYENMTKPQTNAQLCDTYTRLFGSTSLISNVTSLTIAKTSPSRSRYYPSSSKSINIAHYPLEILESLWTEENAADLSSLYLTMWTINDRNSRLPYSTKRRRRIHFKRN